MRRAHILKQNATSRLPLRLIWVDTEALNEQGKPAAGRQRLYFGVALYEHYKSSKSGHPMQTDRIRFDVSGDFWDWATGYCLAGRSVWIMAHNWNYDAGILSVQHGLSLRGWESKKYINGKPPLIVEWVKYPNPDTTLLAKDRGCPMRLLMVDTLNYFTTSVADLGRAVGLEKLDMPEGNDPTEWDTYAWRDVEIIRLAFLKFRSFVGNNDLGVMQATLASQAMTAYRHKFMHWSLLIHDDESALKLERESYHGGRTEAYYRGSVVDQVLYKLDVNSMYPAIMASENLGYWFKGYFPSFKSSWWAEALNHSVVARCLIKTDEPCYGVVTDKLIFPVGQFTTVLTTPEIHYALERGHLQKVYEFAYYKSAILFDEFVEYFYEKRAAYRKEGDDAFSFMCKILMNSLYGKFGQNGRKWEETTKYSWDELSEGILQDGDNFIHLRQRLGKTQVLKMEGESENSAPIIASEITAHGRMQLWKYIRQAGEENVFYCDTDSLITNRQGIDNLRNCLHPTMLGALKIEGESYQSEFLAPKHYTFGNEWKIKGIRKTATQRISDHGYEQEQFRSWDFHLSKGQEGFIDVLPIVKHVSGINTKRIVSGDGWTRPLELWED